MLILKNDDNSISITKNTFMKGFRTTIFCAIVTAIYFTFVKNKLIESSYRDDNLLIFACSIAAYITLMVLIILRYYVNDRNFVIKVFDDKILINSAEFKKSELNGFKTLRRSNEFGRYTYNFYIDFVSKNILIARNINETTANELLFELKPFLNIDQHIMVEGFF